MVDFTIVNLKQTNRCNWQFLLYIFGRKSSPKITLFHRFFRQKNWFKNQKSAFTAIVKTIHWYLVGIFSLAIFAGHVSAILLEPESCIWTWLVRARKEFRVIESCRERRTLLIPISKIFYKCWASQSCQRNIVSTALFTSQNSPKLSWWVLESVHRTAWDDFTREPPCLLRSLFGGPVSVKPLLTSVFFQRLAFTPIPA